MGRFLVISTSNVLWGVHPAPPAPLMAGLGLIYQESEYRSSLVNYEFWLMELEIYSALRSLAGGRWVLLMMGWMLAISATTMMLRLTSAS